MRSEFANKLYYLFDELNQPGFSVEAYSADLMRLFLRFGAETPYNLNCAAHVVFGPVTTDDAAERYGFTIAGQTVALQTIYKHMEALAPPSALADWVYPLNTLEWQACMRLAATFIEAFSPVIGDPDANIKRQELAEKLFELFDFFEDERFHPEAYAAGLMQRFVMLMGNKPSSAYLADQMTFGSLPARNLTNLLHYGLRLRDKPATLADVLNALEVIPPPVELDLGVSFSTEEWQALTRMGTMLINTFSIHERTDCDELWRGRFDMLINQLDPLPPDAMVYTLYGVGELSPSTMCSVVNLPEIEEVDEVFDDVPNHCFGGTYRLAFDVEMLSDVVRMARLDRPQASAADICEALLYYIDFDSYLDLGDGW